MSETLGSAVLVLRTDNTRLDRGLKRAAKKAKALGVKMRRVGRALTVSVTLPVIGFGVAILRAAANFEKGMNQVQALTGATGEQLIKLSNLAKKLGATTQFSAGQAADAMGFLAQAGLKTNQIYQTMPAVLNLAAASGVDLATTADLLTNIMQGFNIVSSESARVSDILTAAFTGSNTNLIDLAQAMSFAAPVAKGFGMTLAETAAIVGFMGNVGIKASRAGTALSGAMVRMASPTSEAARVMKKLGVNVHDADGKLKGFTDIILEMKKAGAGTTEIMKLFGLRAGPATAALIRKGDVALRAFTETLKNSAGRAAEVAAVQMKGLSGAMKAFTSALEAVAIAIADSGLLEWATDMATAMAEWLRELAKTNPKFLKWGVIIGGVAAAVGVLVIALGVLIPLLGTVAALVSLIWLPMLVVIVVIGALVAAWWWLRDETRSVWDDLAIAAKVTWGVIKALFFDPWMQAIRDLVNAWHAARAFFTASGIDTGSVGRSFTIDSDQNLISPPGHSGGPSMGDRTIGSGRDESGRIIPNNVNITIEGGDDAVLSGRQVRQLVEQISKETADDSTRIRIQVL